MTTVPLAWRQLTWEKSRLAAALAGIGFAVVLMLMQLGFQSALYISSLLFHSSLRAELVLLNPQYEYLDQPKSFTERRLYQALAVDGVQAVVPIYMGLAIFKNPETHAEHNILVIGFKPRQGVLDVPGLDENLDLLRQPDVVLFDSMSRPEFGPIPRMFQRDGHVTVEVARHSVEIAGLFRLGTSFGAFANLITSDVNYLRLLRRPPAGEVNLGLVQLKPGVSVEQVKADLQALLPNDVQVVTRAELIDIEKEYWAVHTPIGFVFTLGLIMGLVVGAVIVYQILYTDVSDHLREYATLKAMGYPDRYLLSVVLRQSLTLSVLGYLPGLLIAQGLYVVAKRATLLPLDLTWSRILFAYLLTAGMCATAAFLAVRKLRVADPADIF